MIELEVPFARSVLVVAPHPDDETLGCGGLLALCADADVPTRVLFVSGGGAPASELGLGEDELVRLRRAEALAAAAVLGVRETRFLGLPDGALAGHRKEIERAVDESVATWAPDLVLAPSPTDYHSDHVAVAEVCFEVFSRGGFTLGFFEVYGTTRANRLLDIAAAMERKGKAILCYRKSLFDAPEVFLAAARGMARFHSFHSRRISDYEAFWFLTEYRGADQIVSQLTAGMTVPDAAAVLLSKLTVIDRLLDEVAQADERLSGLGRELEAAREQLGAVLSSRGWRLLDRLRNARQCLRRVTRLPHGKEHASTVRNRT